MPPEPASAAEPAGDLIVAFLGHLRATGRGPDRHYERAAECFFERWPQPALWAAEPLEARLAARTRMRMLVTFLMLHGHLRPGYDYLIARRFISLWRELMASPLRDDMERFVAVTRELGFADTVARGAGSLVAARVLIQTGKPLAELTGEDLGEFADALAERDQRTGRPSAHYRRVLFTTRSTLYHLGILDRPPVLRPPRQRRTFAQRLANAGVPPAILPSFVAYVERLQATHAYSTICGTVTHLGFFGRHLATVDPRINSLAELDRRRHIETYLAVTARATRARGGGRISIEEQRHRIITINCFLNDIGQWGWSEAPPRRLVFPKDIPRRPQPLPRYLPVDEDRRLTDALQRSPRTLAANALLLARATGIRIGELIDLELDCVHEIPGQGAWLKVPLGKLKTERMVPLDTDTVAIVDRIAEVRSPGLPLPHPRDGRRVEFLLTHHGKRITNYTLRRELQRAATQAGLSRIVPHQLRHTYATALVNAGVSLQALMALLGHSSAEMSLRYGRLFDQTVRADYERALALAKERLGPVLPAAPTHAPDGDWRELPLIKSRLAGGYCLRTAAQGVCAYTNICEHCPNFRSEPAMLAVLSAQRADAHQLAEDAQRRGWTDEATRHTALVDRLDAIIARSTAA
jgi:integrase